jgi:methylglyoxal synthase
MANREYGTIAFITTERFRTQSDSAVELRLFVYKELYRLCSCFNVLTTGGTYKALCTIVDEASVAPGTPQVHFGSNDFVESDSDLEKWRRVVRSGLMKTMDGFRGMIAVARELVEGRLDAVLHLTDWQDKSAKPDSAVLSREANVHNVPIATDIRTARQYVRAWNAMIEGGKRVFRTRASIPESESPTAALKTSHHVIGLISHDNMKLEMCRFVVEHAAKIAQFDHILATGTTGGWVEHFMAASTHPLPRGVLRPCNSGPKGGDIQIAFAVVNGWCERIIFLQDPTVTHPHDSDIRLFEQAVISGVNVTIATNTESARFLM